MRHTITVLSAFMIIATLGCAGDAHRGDREGSQPIPRGGATIGIPWEADFGTKSVVRFRDDVVVAAQLAWDNHGHVIGDSLQAQMRQAYANVGRSLEAGGATFRDVVEETLFVTDMTEALAVGPGVRREFYGDNPTIVTSIVEVKRLADPKARIAIKVSAKLDIAVPRSKSSDSGSSGSGRSGGRSRRMGGGFGGGATPGPGPNPF